MDVCFKFFTDFDDNNTRRSFLSFENSEFVRFCLISSRASPFPKERNARREVGMTKRSDNISPTRYIAAILCLFVVLTTARGAANASEFSNGLLLLLDGNAPLESEGDDSEGSLFTSLVFDDESTVFAQEATLLAAFSEKIRPEEGTLEFDGQNGALSQDVVVRGSVRLPSFKALQFWGNAYSGQGHVNPNGWNGPRVKNNFTGASLGLNLPLGAATITGFYNYHRDREFLPGARVEQQDNSYGLAFYLNSGGFYISASGLYGTDDYTAKQGEARKEFDGSQCSARIETGYTMMQKGMFVLEPYAGYNYFNVRHDGFDPSTWEDVGGKKKYNSCTATLGSRVNLNLAGLDCFTLQGRMAWITELRSRAESATTFAYGRVPGTYAPASPYYVGSGVGKDMFQAGAGLRLSLLGTFAFSVDYDALFNKRQTVHVGSLSLLFGF